MRLQDFAVRVSSAPHYYSDGWVLGAALVFVIIMVAAGGLKMRKKAK